MRKLALLTILSAVLLVQGCGFHLRGKVELSPVLSSVYVEGTDPNIVADLNKSLEFSSATLAASPSAAQSVVLVDSLYERRVRTLDARGIATGYTLEYKVRFNVVDPEGKPIYESSIMTLRRNFDFDATQVLQKDREEEFLKEDMRESIVQRVMRQLSTI